MSISFHFCLSLFLSHFPQIGNQIFFPSFFNFFFDITQKNFLFTNSLAKVKFYAMCDHYQHAYATYLHVCDTIVRKLSEFPREIVKKFVFNFFFSLPFSLPTRLDERNEILIQKKVFFPLLSSLCVFFFFSDATPLFV